MHTYFFIWIGGMSTPSEKSLAMLKADELEARNRPPVQNTHAHVINHNTHSRSRAHAHMHTYFFIWIGGISTPFEKSLAMLKADELEARNRPPVCKSRTSTSSITKHAHTHSQAISLPLAYAPPSPLFYAHIYSRTHYETF